MCIDVLKWVPSCSVCVLDWAKTLCDPVCCVKPLRMVTAACVHIYSLLFITQPSTSSLSGPAALCCILFNIYKCACLRQTNIIGLQLFKECLLNSDYILKAWTHLGQCWFLYSHTGLTFTFLFADGVRCIKKICWSANQRVMWCSCYCWMDCLYSLTY